MGTHPLAGSSSFIFARAAVGVVVKQVLLTILFTVTTLRECTATIQFLHLTSSAARASSSGLASVPRSDPTISPRHFDFVQSGLSPATADDLLM
jgi:hypothetical protein